MVVRPKEKPRQAEHERDTQKLSSIARLNRRGVCPHVVHAYWQPVKVSVAAETGIPEVTLRGVLVLV
jgi:hypothetical protein